MEKSKPNILFIITDQQFAEVMSCRMGKQFLNTPSMDGLAAGGLLCSRAYSSNPLCIPLRNSLFTGRYPHETGITSNDTREPLDPQKFPCMGTYFRNAGYETAYSGKWHLNFNPRDQQAHGFEIFAEKSPGGHDAGVTAGAEKFLAQAHAKPFLLVASYLNPHNICEWARRLAGREQALNCGEIGTPPALEQLPPPPANLAPPVNEPDGMTLIRRGYQVENGPFPVGKFTPDDWRKHRWGYYRMAELVDAEIGKLLAALKKTGLAGNTLIVFTADHGDCAGAHGFNQKTVFYEESARVPLLINWPGRTLVAVSDKLINIGIDILPTLLDAAGVAAPPALPGRSLLPLALGKGTGDWREFVVVQNHMVQTGMVDGLKPEMAGRMVRTDRYKYCVYGCGQRRESLVDLQTDPGEMKNLAADPNCRDILLQHRALLTKYGEEQHDPLVAELLANEVGPRPFTPPDNAMPKAPRGNKRGKKAARGEPPWTSAVAGHKSGPGSLMRNILRSLLHVCVVLPLLNGVRLCAAEPVMDVYVSTGDNHFLGSSLPIDSPASIEATFDLFKNVNHARRIYWRGLEEACWVSTMHERPENCRYHSYWEWTRALYAGVKPDELAVKAARARGMEIWGMGTLWDWGAPADTPTFNDYPFPFESQLKRAHPEWAPADKHGARRQGGPLELGYPEARKALVELTVRETLKAGYDGICLLTYVENYALRFQDEFGYSDPIVKDFQQQYKLDLRTEPFRRFASREDWLRLRGGYVTAFLRELKAALEKHKVKLGMVVNSNDPRQPQSWNVPELVLTAGSHHMDVDTWVREGLVDALLIYGNNSGPSQVKTLEDLRFLARGTKTEVSVLTSGPFREGWKPFQDQGMPTVLAVSDDAQHLERGFVPEQTAAALQSQEVSRRQRALQQCVTGALKLDDAALAAAVRSPNLIERRLALQALGKAKATDLQPLLAGLGDAENGARCAAALALADRKDPAACQALLQSVERNGNHMLRECVIIALRKLMPLPVAELSDAALNSKNAGVREVALRTLQVHAKPALLPVFRAGMKDTERFPRFAAAEALGNITHSAEAIELLIATLKEDDPAIANRAAASLGKLVTLKQRETEPLRGQILAALLTAFERHRDATRADADWGWRPVGNAILDCGTEGVAALCRLRDHSGDARLAELAWRVADLTQRVHAFSWVTPEQNEAAMQRRPPRGRDLRVGVDVKTIAEAIKKAQPGDTVHLQPIVYHDFAGFFAKQGAPGKPVTLDGHGATLEGSDPLDPKQWKEVAPGLFANDNLLPRLDDAVLTRWFFLWNGKMNHMNRTSKGPKAPFKKMEELQPGEWTFVQDKAREKPPSKQVFGTFYVKIPAGQKLADAHISAPMRSAGVQLSGANAHLVIRNITATHVYNDGFNIHGDCRDVVFENIRAIGCGDDGISAHESAEYRVDGLVSIGNSTGITDTGGAHTSYNHVFIAGCLGYDLFFLNNGRYQVANAVVLSSSEHPLDVSANQDEHCELILDNVLLRRLGKTVPAQVTKGATLQAKRVTVEDMDLTAGGVVTFENCLVNGKAKPEGTPATGADKAQLIKAVVPAGYQAEFTRQK